MAENTQPKVNYSEITQLKRLGFTQVDDMIHGSGLMLSGMAYITPCCGEVYIYKGDMQCVGSFQSVAQVKKDLNLAGHKLPLTKKT